MYRPPHQLPNIPHRHFNLEVLLPSCTHDRNIHYRKLQQPNITPEQCAQHIAALQTLGQAQHAHLTWKHPAILSQSFMCRVYERGSTHAVKTCFHELGSLQHLMKQLRHSLCNAQLACAAAQPGQHSKIPKP